MNDTYLKFWRNVDSYDLEKASLVTYLKVIARNTALNRLRDTKRHEDRTHVEDISDIANVYADQSQNIENQIVRKEDMVWMNEMIASLPERDRELMIRKYFYLQSSKVIAKSMCMTVTAVDSKLSRLRTKFKQEFHNWEREERG